MAKKPKKPKEPSSPGKKSFHRHVERAIAHNEKAPEAERKSVHVHYQKLNGRTVKRKISPLKMNGHTIIAYDHKRKALRSFRMERVKHMNKEAFWSGFEKVAIFGFGKKKEEPVRPIPEEHVKRIEPHWRAEQSARKQHMAGKMDEQTYMTHADPYMQAVAQAEDDTGIPNHHIYDHFNKREDEEDAHEKKAFRRGFEKAAETSDDETRLMLHHQASGKKKSPLGRFAAGVLSGAAIGGGLEHRLGNKAHAPRAAAAGAGVGGVIGGLAALGARSHNAKREQARDIVTRPEGPDKDKAVAKANPDRFFSRFSKSDAKKARHAMYDNMDKAAFVHSPAFGHAKNVAEVGGLSVLGKGAWDDYKNSDRGAHAKKKLALEGAGLGVLGVPAAAELGHAAWTGGKQLLGKFHK